MGKPSVIREQRGRLGRIWSDFFPSVGLTERERGLTEGLRSYQPLGFMLSRSSVSRGP